MAPHEIMQRKPPTYVFGMRKLVNEPLQTRIPTDPENTANPERPAFFKRKRHTSKTNPICTTPATLQASRERERLRRPKLCGECSVEGHSPALFNSLVACSAVRDVRSKQGAGRDTEGQRSGSPVASERTRNWKDTGSHSSIHGPLASAGMSGNDGSLKGHRGTEVRGCSFKSPRKPPRNKRRRHWKARAVSFQFAIRSPTASRPPTAAPRCPVGPCFFPGHGPLAHRRPELRPSRCPLRPTYARPTPRSNEASGPQTKECKAVPLQSVVCSPTADL